MKIIVEVSARHVHLCQKDVTALFGRGHAFSVYHPISQRGQYATVETVDIQVGSKALKNVRIVGPVRSHSQIELSRSDMLKLGIDPAVRLSGSVRNTPGAIIIGPKGRVRMKEGVIIPHRHIHASPEAAKRARVRNGLVVSVKVEGKRAVTFHNIIVRIHPTYRWHMHIDTDEGNAAGITHNTQGVLIKG